MENSLVNQKIEAQKILTIEENSYILEGKNSQKGVAQIYPAHIFLWLTP